MSENETIEEKKLNRELYLLIKQANQRILTIERETELKESFATKQLYDYLSSEPIKAITKSGRISLKDSYTATQKIAIIKAIQDFKKSSESSIKGIKKYKKYYSNVAGKPLSYKMSNTYYQVTHNLSDWLYDGNITDSDFWSAFSPAVKTMSKEDWVEALIAHKSDIKDENLRRNLEIMYDYIKKG